MKEEGQSESKTHLQDDREEDKNQRYAHDVCHKIGILLWEYRLKILEPDEGPFCDIYKLDIEECRNYCIQHRIDEQ